ncbi:MAG: universal stress protein [Bacteroidales bacterium]|nr:universal stress protein [Bacteroidales bacterium]
MGKNKILVALDFKTQSIPSLIFAAGLARLINGKLTCLYVIEEPGYVTNMVLSDDLKIKIRREAEKKLAQVVHENLSTYDIPFEIIVGKGKVYNKIIETAASINAQFIVMGKHEASGFKMNYAGTNTLHIIGESKIPVITVNYPSEVHSGPHIALALDLEAPVKEKVAKTIETARLLQANVSVISVLRSDWQHLENKFNRRLSEVQKIFEKYNISCSTKLLKENKENIAKEIVLYAQHLNCDLIMLMTQQELDIHDYYVGETALEIIHRSQLPVLSIIPHPDIRDQISDTTLESLIDPIGVLEV